MKEIRIIACSDLHGSKDALEMIVNASEKEPCDLVVACGDFTTYGTTEYVMEFLKRVKKPVMAVPGNCDIPETVTVLEEAKASVHNTRAEFLGWKFYGFGGGLPTGSDMPFEVEEDLLERSLRSVAVPEGIMITHVPAHGMNDTTRFGHHGGSPGIMRVAREFKPVLALSGHIHESRGRQLTAETVFVNPGPAKHGLYASIVLGEDIEVEFREVSLPRSKPKTY